VTTGHDVDGTDWGAFAGIDTLVVLMGGSSLGAIMRRLAEHGRPPDTPVSSSAFGWLVTVGLYSWFEGEVRVDEMNY
jgi:siroheme synthase